MFKFAKKFVAALAAAAMIASSTTAFAAELGTVEAVKSTTSGNKIDTNEADGTAYLVSGAVSTARKVKVPSTVSDGTTSYTVVGLDAGSTANYAAATILVIPATVKTIKEGAFSKNSFVTVQLKGKEVTLTGKPFRGISTKQTRFVFGSLTKAQFKAFKKELKKTKFSGYVQYTYKNKVVVVKFKSGKSSKKLTKAEIKKYNKKFASYEA